MCCIGTGKKLILSHPAFVTYCANLYGYWLHWLKRIVRNAEEKALSQLADQENGIADAVALIDKNERFKQNERNKIMNEKMQYLNAIDVVKDVPLWNAIQKEKKINIDLQEADLRRANLQGADLYEADLRRANLQEADLREANLQGANLSRADLRWDNLQ